MNKKIILLITSLLNHLLIALPSKNSLTIWNKKEKVELKKKYYQLYLTFQYEKYNKKNIYKEIKNLELGYSKAIITRLSLQRFFVLAACQNQQSPKL